MQNASANALVPREAARPAPMADIQKIAQHMARLNVAALPRNYELFHEAIIGLNAGLAQDIAALGPQPQQPMLDELGEISPRRPLRAGRRDITERGEPNAARCGGKACRRVEA